MPLNINEILDKVFSQCKPYTMRFLFWRFVFLLNVSDAKMDISLHSPFQEMEDQESITDASTPNSEFPIESNLPVIGAVSPKEYYYTFSL